MCFTPLKGIYPTNGSEACKYILLDSQCSILVVEDQKQLEKVRQRFFYATISLTIKYEDNRCAYFSYCDHNISDWQIEK
jgi:long-subunit acyl-CoA synthetase (AMP-forming)